MRKLTSGDSTSAALIAASFLILISPRVGWAASADGAYAARTQRPFDNTNREPDTIPSSPYATTKDAQADLNRGCGQTFNGQLGVPQPQKNTSTGRSSRLARDGFPNSECPNKSCPGNFSGGGSYIYDVWPFVAEASAHCIEITFNGGSCGNTFDAHPSSWCGTYPVTEDVPQSCNPTNSAFLADAGSSPDVNEDIQYSFCVNAGQAWSLLVHSNSTPPPAAGCTYSFQTDCGATCTQAVTCGSGSGCDLNKATVNLPGSIAATYTNSCTPSDTRIPGPAFVSGLLVGDNLVDTAIPSPNSQIDLYQLDCRCGNVIRMYKALGVSPRDVRLKL